MITGSVLGLSVTVQGISAPVAVSHAAATNVLFMRIAHVPEGDEADIVVTSQESAGHIVSVWRVTGTPQLYDAEARTMTTAGTATEFMGNVAGGVALGVQWRTDLSPVTGWIGLQEQAYEPYSNFIFSTAHLHRTEGGSQIFVGVNQTININSVWLAATFTSGGDPGESDLVADLSASLGVSLSAGDGGGGGGGSHVLHEKYCPVIPGLGSEACVTGRTAVPPGYGQILCGQAEYEDPCD